MDESLPYRISYSIDEEKCQKCRHQIGSGKLRIAIMVQVWVIISSYGATQMFNKQIVDI